MSGIAAVFLGELAGLSCLLCALHLSRDRLGLAPIYVAVGLLEVFLFVAGKGDPPIRAELFGDLTVNVGTMFLPLLLISVVMVYVLDGTTPARRVVAALVGAYLVHGIVDEVLFWHATHPPAGTPFLGDTAVADFSQRRRIASLGAVLVDTLVVVGVYQGVRNRLPRVVPMGVPIYVGLVAAMAFDALVFGVLAGEVVTAEGLRLFEKLQLGVAAGVPAAVYIEWQLRTADRPIRVQRDAFEILDLREEIAEIRSQLQEQREQYQQVRSTFRRYVSAEVAEQILSDPDSVQLGGEERVVTILFADIRGYSTVSEHMSPTEVIAMLNRYLDRVGTAILDSGGMINEIEGDGILAVFGAPLAVDDHADRAIDAAQRMLLAVAALNREWEGDGTARRWREAGVSELAIRIGIHTGPVVVGNVGTHERLKYAVIGDTVNTAARIETLNKDLHTTLLVSDATVAALTGPRPPLTPHGAHRVKGRTEPVEVYEVSR